MESKIIKEKDLSSKKSKEQFKEIPLKILYEKLNKNELNIKDIFQNNDCINDLINNINSKFKKIITLKNIKTLVRLCVDPKISVNKDSNVPLNQDNENELRYPYFSCKILCSQCVLLFNLSIQYIKKANFEANNQINLINNNNTNSENWIDEKIDQIYENNENNNNLHIIFSEEKIGENNFDILNDEEIENYFNHDDIQNIHENQLVDEFNEKFNDYIRDHQFETELQLESIRKRPSKEYGDDDMNIINEILDEIFRVITEIKYNKEDDNQAYFGYFQKIVNYLLFNECDITINYLFKPDKSIIFYFYKYLNKEPIKNILENILNILFDNDNKYDNDYSKYIKIIEDLFKQLFDFNNIDKSECICNLIISTIIQNSEKQLINYFFINENNIKNIINFIKEIINKKEINNDKLLIGIIKILCELNDTIMSSFFESKYYKYNIDELDIIKNEYKKINPADFQYIVNKNISYKNIFNIFDEKIVFFIKNINELFNIIKDNIKERWKSLSHTNNTNNINDNNNYNNNNINNQKYNKLGLKCIYEWKYIHRCLKIYIYCFYVLDSNLVQSFFLEKVKKYFMDEEFFHISIWFYFNFRQNNMFQNLYIDIIDLLCKNNCPAYLTEQILSTNTIMNTEKEGNKNNEENIITLSIKDLEKENYYYKKNHLMFGPNIEILKKFFCSFNPSVVTFFQKNILERRYKELFIASFYDRFNKQLDEDYSFTCSEIFNEGNNNDNTYDGNDSSAEIKKYNSFQETVEKYINKCIEIKKKYQNIYPENNNNKEILNTIEEEINGDNFVEKRITIEYEIEYNQENLQNEKKNEKDKYKNNINNNINIFRNMEQKKENQDRFGLLKSISIQK